MKKILSIITFSVIVISMFSMIVPLVKTQANDWSEPQQLTTDSANDGIASIMQDSSGKIWLVWYRTGKLWYKTSLDGGTSWSDEKILVPEVLIKGGSFPSGISLLQDSTGRIWVSWASGQLNWDVYYMTSNDGGLSWSAPQQLTDYPYDDNCPTLVEVCGDVWIIFRSFGLSHNEDIWYRKTSDGGTTWSDPIRLTSHSAMEFTNDAMVDSTGKVWLVWERGHGPGTYDLYYKTSSDHGAFWSPEQQLTDLPDNEGYPSIVEDVSGKIFVFLMDDDGIQQDLCYRTTVDGGNTWSDYLQLTADTCKDSVPYAALINGEIWVVWQSDRSGNWDVWMSKLASPPVTATVNIDPNTLNLKSNGQWITAYITLPEGYNVKDIVAEIVKIDDIPLVWSEIQDSVFMAKFDRAAVQGLTNEPDYEEEEETKFYELTLTVRGKLIDGTPFEGTDTIRVIMK